MRIAQLNWTDSPMFALLSNWFAVVTWDFFDSLAVSLTTLSFACVTLWNVRQTTKRDARLNVGWGIQGNFEDG